MPGLTAPSRRRVLFLAASALACPWGLTARGAAAARDRRPHPKPEPAAPPARGRLVPGLTRYTGEIKGQGQTNPAALTTTIREGDEEWVIEEAWSLGSSSVTEISVLAKDTLFLLRHTSRASDGVGGTIRDLEVKDNLIVGWTGMTNSPDPRHEIFVDTPHRILAWGAGAPQVIATLPLETGYSTSVWNIELPDSVVSRKLEVLGMGRIRIPAGAFTAWKVALWASPGSFGHVLTVWIDTRSHQVLRYDGTTPGPGPRWTLVLEP